MSESNGYIGRSPGDASIVLAREYFQPTGAGKTFLFSSGYDPGYVDVYRNGVKLINVLDYAATDGKNIVLDTPVGVGSTVQVVAYKAFNLGTVESSTNDFTVGTNLLVQSGFGSFGQGITANEINVSGIGTIGIGSFVDIHVSGGATVAGTLVANSFSGDGSALTNVSGIVTANIVSVAITTKDINVSAAATITGALTGSTGTFSGAINIDATTASTSTSTGALIVDGGVGIAKDIFVGDAIDVAKDLKVGAAASFTGIVTTTGDLYVGDSIDVANDVLVGSAATIAGVVKITDSTSSTSTSTGALIVSGGAGIAGDVWIGAGLSVAGTLTHEDVTSIDSVGLITAKSGVNVSGGQLLVGSGVTIGIAGVSTFSGTSDIHLLDNVKLNVGDGSDLSIFHNGSHSRISDTGVGKLQLGGSEVEILNAAFTESCAKFTADGSAEIYYDNSKKWETTNDGTVTTGIATATLGIDAAISVWTLGASGTNHYTFTGPGNLSATNDPTLNLIRGQKYTFKNRSGGHPFRIQSTVNGSAGTQYNTGVTNNDGGDGTNILFDVPYDAPAVLYYQCTAHNNMGGAMYISGSGYETKIGTGITFGSAGVCTFANGSTTVNSLHFGSPAELKIYHDGSNHYIRGEGDGLLSVRQVGTGDVELYSNVDARIRVNGGETAVECNLNGSVDLYYDNIKTFSTNTNGAIVQATEGGDANLFLYADEGDDNADKWLVQAESDGYFAIKNNASGSYETNIECNGNGNVELYYDNSKKLATTNEGIEVTGFTSTTAGMGVTGGLFEGAFIKAGKLSDNKTLGISTANVFYFTTEETTTCTPNIVWNDTYTLNNKMHIGNVATVTVITTADASGYSANWTIDGSAVTEEWVGGSAPSEGGSDGLDIYTLTIIKTANATFKVIGNLTNAT